jgi:membrane associated rhomboid family serine protease
MEHLANNSIALFILLPLLRYFYKEQSFVVLFLGILFSGLGTWLLGRPSYHIGASGLIYTLVSFIFFKGIFTKYYRLVALSFTIVILYGGSVWYMFPNVKEGISWEGHLAGFIVGLVLALLLKTPQFGKTIFYEWQQPDFNPEQDPFMKNFDEKGNFNPPPKPEEVIKDYFNSSVKVVYEFLGGKK